ncbi:non-ribosomal peptide synthetase, partial [Moorena sp. SIO4G3]|uniref:non-ribosomal peptide synthetase n=1 Tax=Moorena sp. SIO4G3 TaxID=2607821 RepID=UPI00142C2014
VQGAWALLLSRYSGDLDVVFGVTVSGRSASLDGVETMVGLFINTLPLRIQVSPGEKLIAWWQQIQQLMSQLQTYCYTPLVEIQGMSEVPGGIPLFESILVFENYPVDSSLLNQESLLELQEIESFEQTNYPLTVVAAPGEQLSIKIIYDPVRFDEDTIRRMLGHLQTIFSAIVENPQLVVGDLPLLSAEEHHQLLVEWNDTASDYPTDKCIHQLFEEQVEKTPDAIAVVFEQEQLTYHQLNQRANQLAHHLLSMGVEPEVLVGICVERSVEMVMGLLGILKAGGAYVPVDPNYPHQRLSYMLEDSGVEVLLTQQSLLESLPQNQARVVCLDSDWGAIEQYGGVNLEVGVHSDNLAYVIYTSGSTGQPKGVAIEHHSPVALCHWAKQTFTTSEMSGVLAATSICFDLSVFELFVTLSLGGRVILAQNALDITNLDTASEITLMNTVPSAIAELLRVEGIPPQVQTVNLAGEPIQNQIVQQLYQHQTIEFVYNLYGPSEDTTYSTQAKLVQGATEAPSIGRPIANTQVYILDSHLQPVPIGVPGELYIGGDGLARGYLNRQELTSEKFIPNPLCNSKSERLYKTGDLARYLPDGNIEFLGRIDNQVKIRGFRIELGEIESVLSSHPQIQQTVVIAREDIPGNKRLVAYIVSEEESLTTNQVREFLKQKLPDYMVPSAFVTLDTLPLTPNGKVDRKALPTPEGEITRENEYVAPRTTIELELTQIWSEVLNLTSVGVQDNFFELGGNSLIAVGLMSKIQQRFHINLPLATLFQSPTIEQLASLLGSSVNTQNPILVGIKTSGNQPPLFCIHPGGGNVLCYADLARHLDQDYPVYGLQSLGLDGQQQPLTSVEEMASHYIEAIKPIQSQGPLHLIGWCMGGLIAYEMAQQLQAKNEPVALLTLIDSYAPTLIRKPSEIDQAMIVNQLAQDWGGLYGQEFDISHETLRQLEPSEQVLHLFEQGKQQGILPSDLEIQQMLVLWEVFKANLIAIYHYQPKAYPGSLLLLNASQTSPAVIEDPTHGWGSLVLGDIQTHTITGDHFTIMKAPKVEGLTAEFNKYLLQIR